MIPNISENHKINNKKGFQSISLKPSILLWEHMYSNQGPSACKADALNQLSYAPV